MEVREKGFYRFIKNWYNRGSVSVATEHEGTIVEITQVDEIHHRVLSKDFLGGWVPWNLPVERCDSPESQGEKQNKSPNKSSFLLLDILTELVCELEGVNGLQSDYYKQMFDELRKYKSHVGDEFDLVVKEL